MKYLFQAIESDADVTDDATGDETIDETDDLSPGDLTSDLTGLSDGGRIRSKISNLNRYF